jgi:hypothetical protein
VSLKVEMSIYSFPIKYELPYSPRFTYANSLPRKYCLRELHHTHKALGTLLTVCELIDTQNRLSEVRLIFALYLSSFCTGKPFSVEMFSPNMSIITFNILKSLYKPRIHFYTATQFTSCCVKFC